MDLSVNWKTLLDRFDARLSKWKANLLSIGGRLTLIKFVLGSLGIYYFSIFKVLEVVLKMLEKKRATFFWGGTHDIRKLAWVKWPNVLASHDKGGLGIGSLKSFNLDLIQKWCWRMISNTNVLWVKVIKALHSQEGGFGLNALSSNGLWMSNLEYRHGELVKKMEIVSDTEAVDSIAIREIHPRVTTLEGQVQTLQTSLHGAWLQNQQLQTRLSEMENREGTLISFMCWMEDRLVVLEKRLMGPATGPQLTKSAHFLPIREDYKTEKLARIHINEIVARHGVPVSIISDRDGRFVSHLGQALQEVLGTKLHMSTAYHPKTDGQKIVQETTEKIIQIKERLKTARSHQKSYADKRLKPLEFKVGYRVLLKVSLWKGVVRFGNKGKLAPRN
nr:RNA-directed DNA polymerase, eukaryota, reverse transcriptase zinc-binding domain protein [Tanacetum cinerariifolium]